MSEPTRLDTFLDHEVTGNQDLDAWIAEQVAAAHSTTPIQESKPTFVIDSLALADWALGKIQWIRARLAEDTEAVHREIAKRQLFLDQQERRAARDEAFFLAALERFYREQRDIGKLGTKTKTLRLPSGKLSMREQSIEYTVDDPDAFLAWCQQHGLTRSKEEPRWHEVKPMLKASEDRVFAPVVAEMVDPRTGELISMVVPGVSVQRQTGEVFRIAITADQEGA